MLTGYIPILAMVILAGVIASVMVFASFLLGPKKPTPYKETPYECGMTPVGSARERFPVKFYLIAMIFIIFDIETIFLYPWAVTFRSASHAVKLFNLIEMAVFVAILFIGYFYILGKNALNWGEAEEPTLKPMDRDVFRSRPPIRFGNEGSGPVDLSKARAISGDRTESVPETTGHQQGS